jgi:adenylate kinase family enzyme
MMVPHAFIFMGRSGSGKGTQANLLLDYFAGREPPEAALHVETGELLRSFIKKAGWTQARTKAVMHAGGYLPGFLPIYIWSQFLTENLSGQEHLLLDGCSRTLVEAETLDSALDFYEFKAAGKVPVIFLEVHEEEIARRLAPRGRHDDTPEGIRNRLSEFDRKVKPVLDYYREHADYRLITIDGGQEIEAVQKSILSHLGL